MARAVDAVSPRLAGERHDGRALQPVDSALRRREGDAEPLRQPAYGRERVLREEVDGLRGQPRRGLGDVGAPARQQVVDASDAVERVFCLARRTGKEVLQLRLPCARFGDARQPRVVGGAGRLEPGAEVEQW